jgi:hypothetical protein
MTHIRNNIEGIEQDDINSILDGIGRSSSLSACRAFAGRSKEITGGEQLNLCKTMYQELIHDDIFSSMYPIVAYGVYCATKMDSKIQNSKSS